jgi:beta-lactam-binding protein with PASTA domain
LKLIDESKLVLGNIYPADKSNTVDNIVKQEPKAGETIAEGSTVDIYLEEIELNQNNEKIVKKKLELTDPDAYTEFISVEVKIKKSNSDEEEQLIDELKRKAEFPLTLTIPVPKNGSTDVQVFLNSEFYEEFTVR